MVALSGIFSDITSLIPSQSAILDSVLAGTAGTVIIAGMKSKEGQGALDPLHLFYHQPEAPTPGAVASPAVSGAVQGGGVMTMSQFLALSPDNQKMIEGLKYTIIPG